MWTFSDFKFQEDQDNPNAEWLTIEWNCDKFKKKPVERPCTKIIAAGVSIKSKEISAENCYAQKNIKTNKLEDEMYKSEMWQR